MVVPTLETMRIEEHEEGTTRRRKLRVLIISMGGERRAVLEQLFAGDARMRRDFCPPIFSPGIPSRELRNRASFFRHCHNAGLLPDAEYEALHAALADPRYLGPNLYQCLEHVPIPTSQQRNNWRGDGDDADLTVQQQQQQVQHYSVELWRKAKTVNRGRAVLACTLAHLTALRTLVTQDFDVLLEDNVRLPVETVAQRMWDCIDNATTTTTTTTATDQGNGGGGCHMRYFGWLGSLTNLQWIYTSHIPHHQYQHHQHHANDNNTAPTTVPCPTPQDIEADLEARADLEERANNNNNGSDDETESNAAEASAAAATSAKKGKPNKDLSRPGGTPVFGAYAYWISKDAYHAIMDTLRTDVGALLWKSKRMRYYHVKPIDKIVPRIIRATAALSTSTSTRKNHNNSSAADDDVEEEEEEDASTARRRSASCAAAERVQISTRPAFFRAPMLASKIHAQWDPHFCTSTGYQLQQTGLTWSDLSLTAAEQRVVAHATMTATSSSLSSGAPGSGSGGGEWLTPAQLDVLQQQQHNGSSDNPSSFPSDGVDAGGDDGDGNNNNKEANIDNKLCAN